MRGNPFTPYFGEVPMVMAGREQLIAAVAQAYDEPMRSPELTMLLSGARGTGKTALLSAMGECASRSGWIVANVTALPGMLEDILERTEEGLRGLGTNGVHHLTGVGVASLVSLDWERSEPRAGNWRTQMNRLFSEMAKSSTGLLITVDEVRADLDEMRQLAAMYQHFTREGKKVALLLAGLPYNISSLVNDKSVSFLRRAKRQRLGRIYDSDVARALNDTVRSGGSSIAGDALALAVDAIQGFPFMLQLVGYHMWSHASDAGSIDLDDARYATVLAAQEMKDQVLEATYFDLSEMDLIFLEAMLQDQRDSKVSDIAERMEKSYNYASQYRRRLLEAGIICEHGRGRVAFELPFFREYLTDRLASE